MKEKPLFWNIFSINNIPDKRFFAIFEDNRKRTIIHKIFFYEIEADCKELIADDSVRCELDVF